MKIRKFSLRMNQMFVYFIGISHSIITASIITASILQQ